MAWLSRVNFVSSDTLSFTDVNNLGNDIRAWGGNVNGGGYTLSNVVISAGSASISGALSAGSVSAYSIAADGGALLNTGFTVSGGGQSGLMFVSGLGGMVVGSTSAHPLIFYANNGERARITTSGNVGIGTTTPLYQLQLSADSAAKPSTNTWTIASDERLKTVLGHYEKGLDAICALRPVRYEYNGLGGMPADGKEHISIIAQEAQEVFPECIGTFSGKLREDDEEETELLNYNGHAITFALINAIKELKAKIDILKASN